MKNFIKTLENNPNGAYDYICDNYHKMSKEELKDITKELLYVILCFNNIKKSEMLESVAIELKERYEEN